ESLSRIIHKDNKLIPAMENAVSDFLAQADTSDIVQLKSYGEQLAAQLQSMSQDRKGILADYTNHNTHLLHTGVVAVDAILAYMQKKADANKITITCKHTPETLNYLLEQISADDLSHMLSDLLENAIIATEKCENRAIAVVFGKLDKDAFVSVADTGQPFDVETLHLLGMQAHTTHENEGGSGIGLTDIWKHKRKYRASLQIQEYAPGNKFSKKITILFNKKNHYVIQSFRHSEISNTQTRGDLYVIPTEDPQTNGGKLK
nr:GHKL domain-containing protein [Lachnospiraceae bacterium]